MLYYIYILECINGHYYTGYTTDIKRRYHEHQQGSAKCKYTRSFPPRKIAACWKMETSLSEVLKIEREIKALSKREKKALIEGQAEGMQFEKIILFNPMHDIHQVVSCHGNDTNS